MGLGLIAVALATVHRWWLGDINNFLIFRTSARNLFELKDLYVLHPADHFDLFKYSPTFALLMTPFAHLPVLPGAVLWNLLNAGVFFYAGWQLKLTPGQKKMFLALTFVELLTSIQNNQSNGLVAGLFLLTVTDLERGRPGRATFYIALSGFIKIFGLLAVLLLPLYPRMRRTLSGLAGWLILLAVLPLLVVPLSYLLDSYRSWIELVRGNRDFWGLSVMYILYKWFGLALSNWLVQAAGLALLILPLARISCFRQQSFRYLVAASILIWMVIFNHKAESPMFILALAGVALWYLVARRNWVDRLLLILTLVLTSLSATDLFPGNLRDTYIFPYALKAFPCILVWLKIQYELLTGKFETPVVPAVPNDRAGIELKSRVETA